MIRALLLAAAAYLVGALPAAHLAGRLARRLAGNHGTWVIVVLEFATGLFAVSLVGQSAAPLTWCLAATAAVAGRQWPLWYTPETPGNGLATAAGALTAVTPLAVPVWGFVWGLAYVVSGYVGGGTIAATLALPVLLGFLAGWPFGLVAVPTCVLILDRQRETLRRLLRGEAQKHHWRQGP